MIDGFTAMNLMRMELDKLPKKKASRQGSQYAIRCPVCGDSRKSDHPHFYIKISSDNRVGIPLFPHDCKLCPNASSKVMTVKTAELIGIKDADLLEYIGSIKSHLNNSLSTSNSNIIAKKLDIVRVDNMVSTSINQKIDYLYNRLRDDDVRDHPENYKIIVDLFSFYVTNKLKPNDDYYRAKELLRMMHDCCVGFISFDNTHINFRDITNTLENRYTQYMIYPESKLKKKESLVETSGIYFVPNKIDSMSPSLKIVMAEGSFDILRAYTDFYGRDSSYGLFASVSNAHGYVPCLTKMLEYGIMFDQIEIYSDSDVELGFYRKFVKPMVPNTPVIIYYNTLSKDVGNRADPCKLSRVTL